VQTNQGTCNGTGTCVMGGTMSCGPYACNPAGTMCLTSCISDGDCASGNYCNTGASQCIAKKSKGAPCAGPGECQTGACADGVCCDTSCAGNCQTCLAAKKGFGMDGDCGNIAAGTDPDNECAGANKVCAFGVCVGTPGAPCATGSECFPTFCVDGVCCNESCGQICRACTAALKGFGADGTCEYITLGTDPQNECNSPQSRQCNGFSGCQYDNGVMCTQNQECLSGNCVDGVCCSTATCAGLCKACNTPGSPGACANIPAGQDPANECAGALVCNGAGACQ
jgi:hypothetical protein